MSEELTKKSQSPIDIAMANLEEACQFTKGIRHEMIDKLRQAVKDVQFSPASDKSMVTMAKLDMVKTLNDLLKDVEGSSMSQVKIKMAQRDGETGGAVAGAVTALLKELRLGSDGFLNREPGVIDVDAEEVLADIGKAKGLDQVTDGEILIDSKLPETTSELPEGGDGSGDDED